MTLSIGIFKSAAKVGIIYDLQNKKSVKNAWGMKKKSYLCKPIIIRESFKRLTVCVLIAFLIGLGERLVNRRNL